MEAADAVGVGRADRAHVGDRAVAQDDVGLPLRGVARWERLVLHGLHRATPPVRPPTGTLGAVELRDAVLHRRMVRRFDPGVAVPPEVVRDLVALAVRAPSAGFSQGWDFVALLDPADRDAFWAATDDGTPPDAWRRGVSAAPALVLCLSDPGAYLDRYAEPDKGWTDRSTDHWPVPYWDTDVAMAAMVMLLGAEDAGLGALFFGVPVERHDAVREALGIPAAAGSSGVVALGSEARAGRRLAAHPAAPPARRGAPRRAVRSVGGEAASPFVRMVRTPVAAPPRP